MNKLFLLIKTYYKPNPPIFYGSLLPALPAFGLYVPEAKDDNEALRSDFDKVGNSIRYGMSQIDLQIAHDRKHDE